MQVLGSLINLSPTNELPLPWWHRAPLGLQDETSVWVALVQSNIRKVPDIIVSVLDPYKWEKTAYVTCTHDDSAGVVAKGLDVFTRYNIALAESATVAGGNKHQLTLICEPPGIDQTPVNIDQLRNDLTQIGFEINTLSFINEGTVIWKESSKVERGWLRNVNWKTWKPLKDGQNSEIDFKKVVVSADTERRLMRYVFPNKNSRMIEISHADHPGVLKVLMDILNALGLNVLSALLRRGGALSGHAVLVAVCEPVSGKAEEDVYEKLTKEIDDLKVKFSTKIRITSGVNPQGTIAPRTANAIVTSVPEDLIVKVSRINKTVPRDRIPIFLSRRFIDDSHARRIADCVRAAVADNGCIVLEAPESGVPGGHFINAEVNARMWAAKAGIVVLSNTRDSDKVGKNIPHEFGFLHGQGKPVLLLSEEGTPRWSNVDGIYFPTFSSNDHVAFENGKPGSIYSITTDWITTIRHELRPGPLW